MTHYTEQREADEIWKNAPEGATHYGGGRYWKVADNNWARYNPELSVWFQASENPYSFKDLEGLLKPIKKQPQIEQGALKPQNPYHRTIIGLDGSKCVTDVYRILDAFEVDSHAVAHAIKKLLAPGKRHAKSREQDLREAIASIEAELLLMGQRI